jgi:hypothetical protein
MSFFYVLSVYLPSHIDKEYLPSQIEKEYLPSQIEKEYLPSQIEEGPFIFGNLRLYAPPCRWISSRPLFITSLLSVRKLEEIAQQAL